uniref:(northern house mosquito) hypothetical protein n=1 Tax=Culex pipiens TaxID=7175 RepID=A0A8D8NRD0_CULPI
MEFCATSTGYNSYKQSLNTLHPDTTEGSFTRHTSPYCRPSTQLNTPTITTTSTCTTARFSIVLDYTAAVFLIGVFTSLRPQPIILLSIILHVPPGYPVQ